MGRELSLASALAGPSDGFIVAIEGVDCRLSNTENLVAVIASHEEEVANLYSGVAIGLSRKKGRVRRLLYVDTPVVRTALITMADTRIEKIIDAKIGLTLHLNPERLVRRTNGQV